MTVLDNFVGGLKTGYFLAAENNAIDSNAEVEFGCYPLGFSRNVTL
jgi:hypothetical protein